MPAFDSAGFRRVVLPAAKTLRTLVISDHTLVGSAAGYDPWEVEHIIPQLVQLKVLALNQIPVRPLLLERLPPKLKHLRLTCLDFLPATAVIDWLRKKFQLRSLKILELRGTMR
ncbi:hypothetical protein EXIGLDRAFT_726279 [Exidia glandulosa HHB12029]|uniref:Uncharacterized protein n=1 Tax=Exidia glandulosa HHB12029 TaxID=1314781 RepID=A0A165DTG7_EXIGL|nr:hypothetical protein EXIGLDRAFT_726279 [Exidia glandulosa HHB12029]